MDTNRGYHPGGGNEARGSQPGASSSAEPVRCDLESQVCSLGRRQVQLSMQEGVRPRRRIRAQARSKNNQLGFTLVELVVAIGVGILLLSVVVGFCSRTATILRRLKIEREIRDSGLLAVESIEKSFRKALEYGGEITDIADTQISAKGPSYEVGLIFDEDNCQLALTVTKLEAVEGSAGGSGSTEAGEPTVSYWPGGNFRCSNVKVEALVGGGYVDGSEPEASGADVIVVQFDLGEDVCGISRPFKAAFAVYGGQGG